MRRTRSASASGFQEVTARVRELYADLRAGKVAPVYLFYGEDHYLREQVARRTIGLLVPPASRATNVTVLPGPTVTAAQVLGRLETGGFHFGEADRRVIWVQDAPFFTAPRSTPPPPGAEPSEAGPSIPPEASEVEALYQRLKQGLWEDVVLLFTVAGKVDKRLRLYRLVERQGVVMEFPALRGEEEVEEFVRLKLRREHKDIEPQALHELMVRTGTSAQALTSEIQKLVTYLGERPTITHQDVVALVAPTAELSVFDLVDAVAEGKTTAALEQLNGLLAQRASPFLILGMLIRQFRLLLQARYALDHNLLAARPWQLDPRSFSQALRRRQGEQRLLERVQAATAEVFPQGDKINLWKQHYYVLWKVFSQAEAFTPEQLTAALKRLLQADLSLKTSYLPPEAVLELLVIDLCQPLEQGTTVDWEELLEGW